MRISDWSSDVCSSDLLLAEEQELGGAESPLALLLNRIWEKARDVLGITPDAFMDWLEMTAPGDVSADAGAGATGARARIADAMDELDTVSLTAIAESEEGSAAPMDRARAEAGLRELWARPFTAAATNEGVEGKRVWECLDRGG